MDAKFFPNGLPPGDDPRRNVHRALGELIDMGFTQLEIFEGMLAYLTPDYIAEAESLGQDQRRHKIRRLYNNKGKMNLFQQAMATAIIKFAWKENETRTQNPKPNVNERIEYPFWGLNERHREASKRIADAADLSISSARDSNDPDGAVLSLGEWFAQIQRTPTEHICQMTASILGSATDLVDTEKSSTVRRDILLTLIGDVEAAVDWSHRHRVLHDKDRGYWQSVRCTSGYILAWVGTHLGDWKLVGRGLRRQINALGKLPTNSKIKAVNDRKAAYFDNTMSVLDNQFSREGGPAPVIKKLFTSFVRIAARGGSAFCTSYGRKKSRGELSTLLADAKRCARLEKAMLHASKPRPEDPMGGSSLTTIILAILTILAVFAASTPALAGSKVIGGG